MSKFDELQSKLIALDQEAARDRELHDRLERKRKQAQQKLENLQNRRTSLDNEESSLQDSLSSSRTELDKLSDQQDQRNEIANDLKKELEGAKKQRNNELVDWWMRTYPQFDEMSLTQLQSWLDSAARRFKPSTSGGSGGKIRHLSVQDAEKLREEKVATKDDEHSIGNSSVKNVHNDDDSSNKTQTLAEKQRIFTNRDENNPIDTESEVEDAEEISSPLGNRDVDKEVHDYIEDHPLPEDHPDSELDRKKLTKHYQSELEM
jgi:predicted RNase H-like nuclease (RuvC/YqgF family)